MDIAEALREIAGRYEEARQQDPPDMRELKNLREGLYAAYLDFRSEYTTLLIQARVDPKPKRRYPTWYEREPDPMLVAYWRKIGVKKSATLFAKLEIKSLEEISEYSEMALLRTPHVGRSALKEIKEAMVDHGIFFTGRRRDPIAIPRSQDSSSSPFPAK